MEVTGEFSAGAPVRALHPEDNRFYDGHVQSRDGCATSIVATALVLAASTWMLEGGAASSPPLTARGAGRKRDPADRHF